MGTWGRGPLPSAHQKSDGLSPACCRPLVGVVAPVRPTGERLAMAGTWGGVQDAGGSGTRPCKGAGSGGYDRPSPLEKGAVAAKGGGWGFLVPCRGRGERRRKKPSVTASPCHLPFQGRFLAGGQCPPLRRSAAGSSRPTDGEQHPKAMPPNRWRAAPRTPGCRSNAETLDLHPQFPSQRRRPRSPPHHHARWDVPGQAHPAGAETTGLHPRQAPVGRKGEWGPLDPPAPVATARPPVRVPRPPSMGVLRGSGA